MLSFREWKLRIKEKARIAELETYIRGVIEAETQGATTAEEEHHALQAAWSITEVEKNELDDLVQKQLLREARRIGIVIPQEHWTERYWWQKSILSDSGVWWLKNQIHDFRIGRAKDWIAIVMPIFSLILSSTIAILGLLVALHRR